jgi:hypothetical protein
LKLSMFCALYVFVAHKFWQLTATCNCYPRKYFCSWFKLTFLLCVLPCAEYSAAFSCRIFVFGRNKKILFRSITSFYAYGWQNIDYRISLRTWVMKLRVKWNSTTQSLTLDSITLLQCTLNQSLTSDNKPRRFWGECVLRREWAACHLALPEAVVERDVDLEDLEAAVAQARLARPLVLARVDADRLKGRECIVLIVWKVYRWIWKRSIGYMGKASIDINELGINQCCVLDK